jgi:DNA polymerase III subunit gamma/tau
VSETASLYRRHRPQSFAEVVGQEHIVRTLRNAIESGKVHHAYLFVGSRGTGKTSMAKILARSLNCVNGPTATPCGVCESCVTIAAGTSLDVLEMDAASNRSVDDIRDLRDRVGYAPAAGHWKVYILDEAHMLTKEAWNAFLKTLEEPPPNTVFVLATTEPQKVMATIVDRCQRFDFQRPSLDQIGEVVQRAAKAEGFEVDDDATALISRSASGSFRDALGTLDQLVSYGGEKVGTESVIELLGVADAELLFDAVDAIASGDAKAALGTVDRLSSSGGDPASFTRDLTSHLRQLIVVKLTGNLPDSFSVTVSEPDRLRDQAARVPESSLIAAIDSLSAALAAIREGDDPRLSLEVALLKVARPSLDSSQEALLRRIERLEDAGGGAPAAGGGAPLSTETAGLGGTPPPTTGTTPSPQEEDQADHPAGDEPSDADASSGPSAQLLGSESGTTASAGQSDGGSRAVTGPSGEGPEASQNVAVEPEGPSPDGPPPPAESTPIDLDRVKELWPAVVEHLRESGSDVLSSVFEGARPLGVDGDKSIVTIGFPASATFNKRKAEARTNVEHLAGSLKAIVGYSLRPVYELLDTDPEQEAEGGAQVSEEELLELIKTGFDAREVEDQAPDEAQRRAEG